MTPEDRQQRSERARRAVMHRYAPPPKQYCALSGLPLSYKKRSLRPTKLPGVDHPVCLMIAQMARKMPLPTFIKLCTLVAQRSRLLHNSNAALQAVGGLGSQELSPVAQHLLSTSAEHLLPNAPLE